MLHLSPATIAAFKAHALSEAPREACGLALVQRGREVFQPCPNLSENPQQGFRIAGATLTEAEGRGLLAILHSHPTRDASPSMADRVGCERTAVPWVILGLPQGDLASLEPEGYVAPLIGRPYAWGVLDCWSLVRDHFAQELGVDLPDFERLDRFWEKGQNPFVEQAQAAGFMRVEELREHDVILMALRSPVPNHAAVYLGDQVMLHHRQGRLSGRELYGGLWAKATTHIYRHRSQA